MHTGPNVLPPLSEFVVTVKGNNLPKIGLQDWFNANPNVSWNAMHYRVTIRAKQPIDVEVVLNDYDIGNGWKIIWVG